VMWKVTILLITNGSLQQMITPDTSLN
jgi:hypothetical protein